MPDIAPVYGEGFLHVARGVIYYTIIFDYIDRRGGYYEQALEAGFAEREEEEARRLMQSSMDSEETLINGAAVRPVVDYVHLHFRGGRRRHSLTFHVMIPYTPVEGVNLYENYYEETRAEYPYTVYWVAPPGGLVRVVESPGAVTHLGGGRIALIRVEKGERVPGYEAVEFTLAASH